MKASFISLLVCSLALSLRAAEPPALWVYYPVNLLVDKNIETLEARMKEAKAAGYSAFTITDSKFGKLGEMDKRYFANIEKVKRIAAENGIELIPMLCGIGCSESLLWNDPDLAEGLPVREASFVVRGGVAVLEAAPIPLDRWGWVDENMTPIPNGLRCENPNGKNARFTKRIKVNPFRQYHVSVEIRTENFRGTPQISPLTKEGRTLNYADLNAKPTQDWTTHHIIFNSLDNAEVSLYFGVWDGKTGVIEWRNAKIEETAFVNLLRRDGAPLTVTAADGKPLTEGRDFEPLTDPHSGTVPWKGCYEIYHEPPTLRTKNLPDGTRLKISFYHAVVFYTEKVMICISEPKTEAILRDHIKRLHAAWGAKKYFMAHDEIRALNWDKSCCDRNLDAGEIVADNAAKCIAWIREGAPDAEIYVWGDMFDPHHNAHKDYYLVRGDLAGAWKGLDKKIIPVPWAVEFADKSAAWFSGLGMRMVFAGYYDAPVARSQPWIDAAKKYPGVEAIIYTTWENNFTDLKPFAEMIRAAF